MRDPDPLLTVEHLKATASALVEELNRSAASGLITRQALVLTGHLQRALDLVGREPLVAVPAGEWTRVVNGGAMSDEHRAMVKAMHEGRHYGPEEAAE